MEKDSKLIEYAQINYLVCVCCFTYNQSHFIKQTMDGFVMQQTDFPFICLIVDDASIDGEPEVIKDFIDKNFDLVILKEETDDYVMSLHRHKTNFNCHFAVYYLKYNHYGKKSKDEYMIRWTANAKYHALCEGDDYWIDSHKLSKQVSILENEPECGMVYTDIKQYIQKDNSFKKSWCKQSSFEDMLFSNKVCTLSVVYRRDLYERYINEIKPQNFGWLMGDYPMWLYFFANSKPFFMNEITGVYRILESSVSHGSSYVQRETFVLSSYDMVRYFANKYGRSSLIKKLSRDEVALLVRDSLLYDERPSVNFTQFFMTYKIFDIHLYLKAIMTHNYYTRIVIRANRNFVIWLNSILKSMVYG